MFAVSVSTLNIGPWSQPGNTPNPICEVERHFTDRIKRLTSRVDNFEADSEVVKNKSTTLCLPFE